MESCVITNKLLVSCRVYDKLASISSVIKDMNGRTVLKIRPSDSNNSVNMLRAVRSVLPLAESKTVINSLDESIETQIVIPNSTDEFERAMEIARNTLGSKVIKYASSALLMLSFLLMFQFTLTTTTNDS